MSKTTLEEVVSGHMESMDKTLPSATASKLQFCSRKLASAKTPEEFDGVLAEYSLLDNSLSGNGLRRDVFAREIEKLKKEYF